MSRLGFADESSFVKLGIETTADHSGALRPWVEQSVNGRRSVGGAEWGLPVMKMVPPLWAARGMEPKRALGSVRPCSG